MLSPLPPLLLHPAFFSSFSFSASFSKHTDINWSKTLSHYDKDCCGSCRRICPSPGVCTGPSHSGYGGEGRDDDDDEMVVEYEIGRVEVPREDVVGSTSDENDGTERIALTQGKGNLDEEVPVEDNNGDLVQNGEQVGRSDGVVQAHVDEEVPAEGNDRDLVHGGEQVGSSERAVPVHVDEEVPVEDNDGDLVYGGEQVGCSDRAVSVHVDEEVPVEDNAVDQDDQQEADVDEARSEQEGEENGGGDEVAQGAVAPPVLFNDDQNVYRVDYDYPIPCDGIVSFLPGWAPRVVYGGPMLGRGSFGIVQLCQDEYGSMCALKTVEFRDEFDAESKKPMLETEVELQALCAGPHVVGAYGHWGTEYEMNLAFEYARFGTGESRIFQDSDMEGRAVSESQAAYVVRAVARALVTCHHWGVAHCDIKLANVLVCEGGVVKLSDFGLALRVEEDSLTGIRTFEPQFAAPEFKGNGRYGTKVDLWAVGIMLYELLLGTRRWHLVICSAGRDYIPGVGDLAEDARDLLIKLLSEDANDRPSAGEVLRHPWILRNTGDEAQYLYIMYLYVYLACLVTVILVLFVK